MAQMIYSVAAILLLGIAFFNVNMRIHGTQERMMFNELTLGMTSVGAEVLNEVGKYPYDPVALPITDSPVLLNPNVLRDASTFGLDPDGNPVACNPNAGFSGCQYIIDFHGKRFTRTQTRTFRGVSHTVTYNVDVAIGYVTATVPHAPTASKTFARRAVATVSSPAILRGGSAQPLEVSMSRVYTYPNF